jgi:Uma2 family endonuclease
MSLTVSHLTTPFEQSAAKPDDLIWRLSVEQYHKMICAGILTSDDPVELLEGWLIYKMPKNPRHSVTTQLTRRALEAVVPAGWYVDTQEPITLDDSEPEPDVMVVRGEARHYLDHHPGPGELALVVEVAETTLERDRGVKKRLYARAAIAIYWIVNLRERTVEVYSEPSGSADEPDYRQHQDYSLDDLVPVVIEGREVGRVVVRELLPD